MTAAASRKTRWRNALGWIGLGSAALLGTAYVLFTGPHDLDRYPQAISSPYKLPWPKDVSWLCIQSNRGIVSHRGNEEYAFDFKMPVGSDVCAARDGQVLTVNVRHDGNGMNAPNNRIVIEHPDGSRGVYLHLQKDGSLVKAGETVRQGQKIARSGNVGRSMTPHLHFHVTSAQSIATLPISFSDVAVHEGVPRMFHRYTSGNQVP
jgi:murein DD-endopeptidase MepM/ murein hydrolase activator NlpD